MIVKHFNNDCYELNDDGSQNVSKYFSFKYGLNDLIDINSNNGHQRLLKSKFIEFITLHDNLKIGEAIDFAKNSKVNPFNPKYKCFY